MVYCFGNTAVWLNDGIAAGGLGEFISSPEILLFKFLNYLPLPTITGFVSLLVISLFLSLQRIQVFMC